MKYLSDDEIWYAAMAKELIKLGDKIYELTKDEKVESEVRKLRKYIADL